MSFSDKIMYAYIKNVRRWMDCPVCYKKLTFKEKRKSWVCDDCSYYITEQDFLDDFVFWFCDGCETYLNIQPGFSRKGTSWVCTKCGFNNDTTSDNIKGECKDCGKLLDNPNATICSECKILRMNKAQAILEGASEICFTLSNSLKTDNSPNKADYVSTFETDEIEDDDKNKDCCNDEEAPMSEAVHCGNANFRKRKNMSYRFPNIDWYCDRCNAYLNDQPDFDDHHYVWKCIECGHKNSISSDDIYESEEAFHKL